MARLAGCDDPLLGRALALFDTFSNAGSPAHGLELVYLVAGKFTSRLARVGARQELEIWGPLGNGFPPRPTQHLVMVAGGIGYTPFLALAKEYLGQRRYGDPPRKVPLAQRVTLCYGVRTRDLLASVSEFAALGVDVRISTNDGSAGAKGLVTDVLCESLTAAVPPPRIVCCGPEPMMATVARIAAERGIRCQVSLETPMACGLGICFSCVAKVRTGDSAWDYRRTCVEGPVFDAEKVEF